MDQNVLACVMAFYPGNEFENICRLIAENCTFLLIIDNSPESSLLSQNLSFPENSTIIYNKNKGAVAGALNIALAIARNHKFDYLQMFDQDTVPPLGLTASLIKTLSLNRHAVLVSPRFINVNTNYPGRVIINVSKWKIKSTWPMNDEGLINALITINSASIVNMNILPDHINYDERLIVDGCDVDFCLALRELNFEILVDTSQSIIHGIGNRKTGSGRWSATNYSPLRRHLIAKNKIIVWRRYFKRFPGFVINDSFVFALDIARTLFFERNRFGKLRAVVSGLIKGIREKNIRLREHNPSVPVKLNEYFGSD